MSLTLADAITTIQNHPKQAQILLEEVIERNLLDTPIRADAWTPRQIFHHLADSHINSYTRIKLAISEKNPTIKPYNEAVWAELQDVKDIPVEVSLQILDGIHQRIGSLLNYLHSQTPEVFNRPFVHPESGDRKLGEYVISFANHGISHLNGIRKLLKV